MPKTDIDYSNTIIYKITCKDVNVKDVYVGHTTNFVQRKHAHKQSCCNDKTANYKCKLYEVIRNNGGWTNWQMEIINFYNCYDHYEARQKEQEYFISLNATLNSIEPMPKPKPKEIIVKEKKQPLYCDICNIYCASLTFFEQHNKTKKHIKNVAASTNTEKTPKNAEEYNCEICLFKCSKQSDWTRHISRPKHLRNTKNTTKNEKNNEKNAIVEHYICKLCNKSYIYHSGLWKHKKTCNTIKLTINDNNMVNYYNDSIDIDIDIIDHHNENRILSILPPVKSESEIVALTNLVIEVVKNNSEFQKQMLDMCKNMQSSIMTNCNNTTNNTTFNLQVFLNEYCKDAMNIGEFIDSFDLQISDLESVGRLGYIEGMSNIIINKIKELDVSKRPLHCSDLKREIIYIKDADVWEREDSNNTKFRKVVSKVMRKNIGMLIGWRDKYPDCMDIESEYNDIYVKLTKEAMGPNDTFDSENKIMKKIVKHIVIDKKAHAIE